MTKITINNLHLGQKVYHKDLYNGKELMEVVGLKIRPDKVELAGDFSGGRYNVYQRSWMSVEGVIPLSTTLTDEEVVIVVNNGDNIDDLIDTAIEIVRISTVSYVMFRFNDKKLFVKKDSTHDTVLNDYQQR